jgi:L-2-hydroxycarboxylate dehydrogenase (NAD+)
VAGLFAAHGVPEQLAVTGAEVLVGADLRGVESHGVSNMLRLYLDWFADGRANPDPQWKVTSERPGTALIDADRGLGIMLAPAAMRIAIEKAAVTGIGMVNLSGGLHIGMCAHHAMLALPHDMIGVCTTATGPLMVPTGGRQPRLGTNPIAVAVPVGTPPAFVFDAAMTAVPGNKVVSARRRGDRLPGGLVADEAGLPVRDSAPAPDTIRLLPLGSFPETGSYKGYGLAAVVEILGSVLAGAGFATRLGFSMANHCLMAVDVSAFLPVDTFKTLMDEYLADLRATEPAAGSDGVLVPGEREHHIEHERLDAGIPLDADVVEWLQATCLGSGVTPPSPVGSD